MFICKKCGQKKIKLDKEHSTCKKCGNKSFTSKELEKVADVISKVLSN